MQMTSLETEGLSNEVYCAGGISCIWCLSSLTPTPLIRQNSPIVPDPQAPLLALHV